MSKIERYDYAFDPEGGGVGGQITASGSARPELSSRVGAWPRCDDAGLAGAWSSRHGGGERS